MESGMFGLVVLFLLLAGGLWFWNNYAQKNQLEAAKNIEEQKGRLEEAVAQKRDAVVRTQAQVQHINTLLGEHLYWSKVFKMINSASISGVQFIELSGSNKGNMLITGVAPDFTTIATFNKKLNDLEGVSQVVLNSSSLSDTSARVFYQFTITVTFDPEILKMSNRQ